jgi:hypothetical protein
MLEAGDAYSMMLIYNAGYGERVPIRGWMQENGN